MQQNLDRLGSDVEESELLLKKFTSFRGDVSLYQACRNMLKLYKKEVKMAEEDILPYFDKKEALEIAEASIKKVKKPSQEQVDNFNKLVKEYNEAGESLNEANESLSKERNKLLEVWNKAVKSFTITHIVKNKTK